MASHLFKNFIIYYHCIFKGAFFANFKSGSKISLTTNFRHKELAF